MNRITEILSAYRYGMQRTADCVRGSAQWWSEHDELPMEEAEAAATQAFTAAQENDFSRALRHAHRACRFEMFEYGTCPTWRRLFRAIRSAADVAAEKTQNKVAATVC